MNTAEPNFFDEVTEQEDETNYNLLNNTDGNRRMRRRLRIVREDGSYFSVHYDDIHTLEGVADGTLLTLIIKGGLLVTLTGERLVALADHLDEYRVRSLYVYQPNIHTLKDAKTPVITSITEKTAGK